MMLGVFFFTIGLLFGLVFGMPIPLSFLGLIALSGVALEVIGGVIIIVHIILNS